MSVRVFVAAFHRSPRGTFGLLMPASVVVAAMVRVMVFAGIGSDLPVDVSVRPCGRPVSAELRLTESAPYRAIRCTERLVEAGALASVGSRGDSYGNALAEAFNSLFKAELVRHRGPWRSIDDLEFAVAEYIDWFSHRLHSAIGIIPPIEAEQGYDDSPHAPVADSERVAARLR